MKMCSPECMFFPAYPSSIQYEFVDENGVKRRSSTWTCLYDGKRIVKFDKCKNFRILKEKNVK